MQDCAPTKANAKIVAGCVRTGPALLLLSMPTLYSCSESLSRVTLALHAQSTLLHLAGGPLTAIAKTLKCLEYLLPLTAGHLDILNAENL